MIDLFARELRWEGDWPDELKPVVEQLVKECSWLLPRWARWVHVYYQTSHDSVSAAEASVTLEEAYRTVYIYIHAPLFDVDERDRRAAILHEITHALLAPISELSRRIIKHWVTDEQMQKHLLAQHLDAVEATTQDVAEKLETLWPAVGGSVAKGPGPSQHVGSGGTGVPA